MPQKESSFRIEHDLGKLSNEAREQYLRDASVYFKLDPNLNALDTIWMPDDRGTNKLVAYARKGTTDILRGIHGIDVMSLVKEDGPGYVAFTATGKDKLGRQEIAMGAHSIAGLMGERHAYAVMTAQTRALRRLTLQFVGGGLLDSSEVNDQTNNAAAKAELAGSPMVMPAPQVPVTSAPGKDITPQVTPITPDAAVTPRPVLVAQAVLGMELQPAKTRAKKVRKNVNEVDMNSPGQVPVEKIVEKTAVSNPSPEIVTVPLAPTPAVVVDQAALHPTPVSPKISEEKKKELAERYGQYAKKILPEGGMVASQQYGVTMKIRLFSENYFNVGTKFFTEAQWEELLKYLGDYAKEHGTRKLVEHIEKTLETIKC